MSGGRDGGRSGLRGPLLRACGPHVAPGQRPAWRGSLGGVEDGSDELDLELSGILAEVGNIMINAVLGSVANATSTRLSYGLPEFYSEPELAFQTALRAGERKGDPDRRHPFSGPAIRRPGLTSDRLRPRWDRSLDPGPLRCRARLLGGPMTGETGADTTLSVLPGMAEALDLMPLGAVRDQRRLDRLRLESDPRGMDEDLPRGCARGWIWPHAIPPCAAQSDRGAVAARCSRSGEFRRLLCGDPQAFPRHRPHARPAWQFDGPADPGASAPGQSRLALVTIGDVTSEAFQLAALRGADPTGHRLSPSCCG